VKIAVLEIINLTNFCLPLGIVSSFPLLNTGTSSELQRAFTLLLLFLSTPTKRSQWLKAKSINELEWLPVGVVLNSRERGLN